MCVCVFRQHFFVNANFIKHNRHFMSTYFLLDPFEFPYYFYRILGELIYVLSIVACIPSTFCPTLGHHQERIYYISETCSRHLIELIFKPVLMSLATGTKYRITQKQMSLATGTKYRITFKNKRHNLQRQRRPYTVVIC